MAEGKGIPDSVAPVIAHLVVSNGAEAIAFYTNAFGAESFGVHYTPDGKLMHAELKIGNARLMLADEFPSVGCASPKTLGGTTVVLNLYSEDVDTLFDRAVKAGAMVTMPLANQFWGDRYGQITDPFGHRWALGQHVEDVAPEEMERRAKEAFAQMGKAEAQHQKLQHHNYSIGPLEAALALNFRLEEHHEQLTAESPRC